MKIFYMQKVFYLAKQVYKTRKIFVSLFNFLWDDAGFVFRAFDNILNVEFAISLVVRKHYIFWHFYNITIISFEFSFK